MGGKGRQGVWTGAEMESWNQSPAPSSRTWTGWRGTWTGWRGTWRGQGLLSAGTPSPWSRPGSPPDLIGYKRSFFEELIPIILLSLRESPAVWWLLLCLLWPRTWKPSQESCYPCIHLKNIYDMVALCQEIYPSSPDSKPVFFPYRCFHYVVSCFTRLWNITVVTLKCLQIHECSSFGEGEPHLPPCERELVYFFI